MLYLTCTTITSVDLAHYRISHSKDWVSVDCGTSRLYSKAEWIGNLALLSLFNSISVISG